MSAFAPQDGVVYHTCSACARGMDGLWGWASVRTARAPRGGTEQDMRLALHDEYRS